MKTFAIDNICWNSFLVFPVALGWLITELRVDLFFWWPESLWEVILDGTVATHFGKVTLFETFSKCVKFETKSTHFEINWSFFVENRKLKEKHVTILYLIIWIMKCSKSFFFLVGMRAIDLLWSLAYIFEMIIKGFVSQHQNFL